jgi:hypothetical protein
VRWKSCTRTVASPPSALSSDGVIMRIVYAENSNVGFDPSAYATFPAVSRSPSNFLSCFAKFFHFSVEERDRSI